MMYNNTYDKICNFLFKYDINKHSFYINLYILYSYYNPNILLNLEKGVIYERKIRDIAFIRIA